MFCIQNQKSVKRSEIVKIKKKKWKILEDATAS